MRSLRDRFDVEWATGASAGRERLVFDRRLTRRGWLGTAFLLGTCRSTLRAEPEASSRHVFRSRHMGTEFTLLMECDRKEVARRVAESAWKRVAELEQIFTDYDGASEARRLAASAPHRSAVPVSRELWTVCRYARTISEQTCGAFDVTIGPLTRLWRRAHQRKRLPDPKRLAEAKEGVGYRFLVIDSDRPKIQLTRPGMRLDFGGIAKGYALDEVLRTVQSAGIERALINGGGDLACLEAPHGARGWPVRIPAWFEPTPPPTRYLPPDSAVATSGDRWKFLEVEGKRYSHLIDPRTGWAVIGRRQASVLAERGMESDALASAFTIMDPTDAARCAANRRGVGAWLAVEASGEVRQFRVGPRAAWFRPNASRKQVP